MNNNHTALVLEGGGFRGIYSAGVLDRFLDEDIHFPYVIGVSMGAIVGANYVSRQRGRMLAFCRQYAPDKKYMGMVNLITSGNFFSHDYGYRQEPRRFKPFDLKTYYEAPEKFYLTCTNADPGAPAYFEKGEEDVSLLTMATSALPFFSQMIKIGNGRYMDGGIADSVPIEKALADGYTKQVVVLTRAKGYRKEPYEHKAMLAARYAGHPDLVNAVLNRHIMYNQTMDRIEELEAQGSLFVIRPTDDIDEDMIIRDEAHLQHNYDIGEAVANQKMAALKAYLAR